MPRQKNTRPTHIYWLLDVRPETIAAGWAQGLPFYCGKTVCRPIRRLWGHRDAVQRNPIAPVSVKFRECGNDYVQITVLEIVPIDQDWRARERHWIAFSRRMFPDVMTNVSDGGEGAPGVIITPEVRARIGAANKLIRTGKPLTLQHRANISAALLGKAKSTEHCAKISASLCGKKLSPEHRFKLSMANSAAPRTASWSANISAGLRGKKRAPRSKEWCAKLGAALRGKSLSSETREKMSKGQLVRRAAIRVAQNA